MEQPTHRLPADLASVMFSGYARQTNQAVIIADLQPTRILYMNPAARELWDAENPDGTEGLDRLILKIHREDRDHTLAKINRYLNGDGPNGMEFRITLKDAEQWICLTLYSIGDGKENRPQLLAMAENITKRKDYELYLLRHTAKKNSILNILSHDLRGPLSAIGLASGMLREQRQKGILGDGDDLTGMIERTCTQALELINQYVDSEMLESSDIEVKKTRVEMVGRVSSIIDTFKITDGRPDRTFTLEAVPGDKIWVETDDVKLLQVINNLVSNAIKFTRQGGSIAIRLEETGGSLLVTVRDDGIGIPEELHPFLFEEFTKARRKGLKGEETVGLGLSITKKLVEIQGGKIWFESREGEGTAFFVEIPKA